MLKQAERGWLREFFRPDTTVANTDPAPTNQYGLPTRDFEAVWSRRAFVLIAGLLVVRLVYLVVSPLNLIHDEAYYWDWSRHLDIGYYSKPPMIAWLIGASTRLFGATESAVRLPAVLLGTLSAVGGYLLASRMFDARTGFWAVALAAATPGVCVMSLLMTIDAPFLFCWTAALFCFWQMLEAGRQHAETTAAAAWSKPGWMLAAACFAGLGLLSKQTMLGFFPLAGVFLLLSREDRREIIRPHIYGMGLIALAFLAPVILWNIQHDWITLEHTRSHFESATPNMFQRFAQAGEYLAGQGGVVSPIAGILVLTVFVAAAVSLSRWDLPRRELFLICFSGLPLAGVLMLAFKQRIEPNWPAPFYVAAFVLVSAWACGTAKLATRFSALRRLFVPGIILGAVLCLAVYAAPFALPRLGLSGHPLDVTNRLRGWDRLGDAVGLYLRDCPRPQQTFVLAVPGRAEAAELAFYLPHQPTVYSWNGSGHVTSQYDLWPGPESRIGDDALLLTRPDEPLPTKLADSFVRVQELGEVVIPLGRKRKLAYRLYLGRNLATWPAD